MRRLFSWKSGVAAAVLMLGMGVSGAVQAQQPVTIPMTVTDNRAPGVAGQTTMTPLPNNQVRVDIRLTGLAANAEHAAHIHTAQGARCDTNAPVTYPLTNVRADGAGVGTSTTTVTLTAAQPVNANNAYVNVHQGATPPGQGVICGNITTNFVVAGGAPAAGGPAPAGGQPGATPRTGTGIAQGANGAYGWVLGGFAALLLLAGGVSARAVSRRR